MLLVKVQEKTHQSTAHGNEDADWHSLVHIHFEENKQNRDAYS